MQFEKRMRCSLNIIRFIPIFFILILFVVSCEEKSTSSELESVSNTNTLNENNLGVIDHNLLTPLDTLFNIVGGIPVSIDITNIIYSYDAVIATENNYDKKEKLIKLPGVGHYTSSAIMAIVFNKPIISTKSSGDTLEILEQGKYGELVEICEKTEVVIIVNNNRMEYLILLIIF